MLGNSHVRFGVGGGVEPALHHENRVLREQLKGKRIRFTDDQRRRLAAKGKALGRKVLGDVCTLATPETVLRWYRTSIAKKYDGSAKRGPGRPRVKESIQELVVRMAKENVSWGKPGRPRKVAQERAVRCLRTVGTTQAFFDGP